MYGKKSRGSKILATRGRGDFVKFYLAPPKMRVAPQMPPQIPRPGAATVLLNKKNSVDPSFQLRMDVKQYFY